MSKILNIAAYQFVPVANPQEIKEILLPECKRLKLKGTIILSKEGINLMLAGAANAIFSFQDILRNIPVFEQLNFKSSLSERIPFKHMWIKIKSALIPMPEQVDPVADTATHLAPREFKKWLDEKRHLLVLDTRNHYEMKFGAFEGALDLNIKHFADFGDACEKHLNDVAKDETIVMYCTGGIRCEKASALLKQRGFSNVYQLEGGILNYFAECGNAHYQGDCYVFDERVAVNFKLQPVHVQQCAICSMPVNAVEKMSEGNDMQARAYCTQHESVI